MKKILLILSLLTSVANAAEVSSLKDLPKFSILDRIGNSVKTTLLGSYESRLILRYQADYDKLNSDIQSAYRELQEDDDKAEMDLKIWFNQCTDIIATQRRFSRNVVYVQKGENIYKQCEDGYINTALDNRKVSEQWKQHIKKESDKALDLLKSNYNGYLKHYNNTGKETEPERYTLKYFYVR